jgi:LytS/YehU family sensor histidine kinase
MDGRLSLRIEVDATLQAAELPALALATLVENAVKHGITPSTRAGSITIDARGDGADLVVAVADTGVGFGAGSGGSGIGLANTRSRLATRYGGRASLALRANQPSGVVATLRLPWERA